MRRGFSNLGEVLLVILVLTIGYMGGAVSTYEISELGSQTDTVYSPRYNLTCPEYPQETVEASNRLETDDQDFQSRNTNNFIQAPYTDVDYKLNDGEASVEVDAVAHPEGKSMRPTIFSGNTVLLSDFEGGDISEGEILRYSSGDGYVIHRVQANYLDTSDYLLMRGDNNDQSERIEVDQVTNRVVGVLNTQERPDYTSLEN